MAASPFVDPKGFSCADRTPPATSSPVSATRPAFPRSSPPILLFGSPLRKLQPSQLAIEAPKTTEAAKPKRAADEAASRPALTPKTLNFPLRVSPSRYWLMEGLQTPLAPSPVALSMEDSPPALSSSSTSPPSSQPTVDSSLSTLETSAVDPDPPLLGTHGEAASSFKTAMGSGNMQATTNQLVQPNHHRKPPPLSLASLVRAFQLNWMRHHKPVKYRDDFSRYTGGSQRGGATGTKERHRLLQVLSLVIRLPWWHFVLDILDHWYTQMYNDLGDEKQAMGLTSDEWDLEVEPRQINTLVCDECSRQVPFEVHHRTTPDRIIALIRDRTIWGDIDRDCWVNSWMPYFKTWCEVCHRPTRTNRDYIADAEFSHVMHYKRLQEERRHLASFGHDIEDSYECGAQDDY